MMQTRPLITLLLVLALAAMAIAPSGQLGYHGVMGCVVELADLNHDGQLSITELRVVLDRWLSTSEQVMDMLTPHRIMAACDTDNSRQVSWTELTEEPRCLTLAQTQGLAKWLCSRARHGNFVFTEYVALSDNVRAGLVSGNFLKSLQGEFVALSRSQTDARRAALARQLNQTRFSSDVDALLTSLGDSASQILAIPLALVIVIFALIIACLG